MLQDLYDAAVTRDNVISEQLAALEAERADARQAQRKVEAASATS